MRSQIPLFLDPKVLDTERMLTESAHVTSNFNNGILIRCRHCTKIYSVKRAANWDMLLPAQVQMMQRHLKKQHKIIHAEATSSRIATVIARRLIIQ